MGIMSSHAIIENTIGQFTQVQTWSSETDATELMIGPMGWLYRLTI